MNTYLEKDFNIQSQKLWQSHLSHQTTRPVTKWQDQKREPTCPGGSWWQGRGQWMWQDAPDQNACPQIDWASLIHCKGGSLELIYKCYPSTGRVRLDNATSDQGAKPVLGLGQTRYTEIKPPSSIQRLGPAFLDQSIPKVIFHFSN